MFKINIIKINQITNSADFHVLDSANQWLQQEESNNSFGDKESYQVEIKDVSAEIQIQKDKDEAIQYLKDTDWYVIRQMDSGVSIPEEVKVKRQEARLKI